MRLMLVALFVWLAWSSNVQAAFDCQKAALPTDYVICSSPVLLKANDDLASAWFSARAKFDDAGKVALVESQKAWLRETNRQCGWRKGALTFLTTDVKI